MSSETEFQPWSANEYSNLALVQEVKKHPCLYNNTIPEYSQKDVTRAVWQEIADKFGCTVPLLKTKWKHLRSSYGRFIKGAANRKTKKDWYIAKYMEFLNPYMDFYNPKKIIENEAVMFLLSFEEAENASSSSDSKPNSNLQSEPEVAISQSEPEIIISQSEPEVVISQSEPEVVISHVQGANAINQRYSQDESDDDDDSTISAESRGDNSNSLSIFHNEPNKEATEANRRLTAMPTIIQCVKPPENSRRNIQPMSENPRRQFIMSLLPEVNGLSETQFLKFKRKLFQLVDDLMEE